MKRLVRRNVETWTTHLYEDRPQQEATTMGDEEKERQEIEAYLNRHHLQAFLGDTVNDVVKERPKDPLIKLADALRACSDSSRKIQGVQGRQILNGEALPALEVEIRTCQVYYSIEYSTVQCIVLVEWHLLDKIRNKVSNIIYSLLNVPFIANI